MGDHDDNRSGRNRALLIGATATAVLVALAILFASSYSTGLVAANARALHSTNAALGSSAILRTATGQALLFSRTVDLGVSDQEAFDLALEEARRTWQAFSEIAETSAAAPGSEDTGLNALTGEVLALASQSLNAAEAGAWEEGFRTFNGEFETSYDELRTELIIIQAGIIDRIEETESLAGFVSGAIRFLTILLLPILAMVIYRRIARSQMREERRELALQLEYERKVNEVKDELIAGVSHELRTPLTSIYGMSDVLLGEEAIDPETTQELMKMIHNEAYELDRMVSDLLAMARLDADATTFNRERVSMARVIKQAAAPATRAGQSIEIDVDQSTVAIADGDRVVHILRNLLSNARKHGGPNTWIRALTKSEMVSVTVEDDGPALDDTDNMFEAFANDGRRAVIAGSVGLGLAVAQTMAKRMGGDLAYQRFDDRNRFIVRLPAVSRATETSLVGQSHRVS